MPYRFTQDDVQFPAGKYLVIDPCYVFGSDRYDHQFWDDFVAYSFPPNKPSRDPFYVHMDNGTWFTWSTKYGDGSYPVRTDRGIVGHAGVDAGCLALIPFNMIEDLGLDAPLVVPPGGVVVEIKNPFTPSREDGDGFFDDVTVTTSGNDEDEEDDWECDEDEDER